MLRKGILLKRTGGGGRFAVCDAATCGAMAARTALADYGNSRNRGVPDRRLTATAGTGECPTNLASELQIAKCVRVYIFKRKIYNMRCSNVWSEGMQEHVTMLSVEKQAHGAGTLTQQQDQVRTRESWLLDCRCGGLLEEVVGARTFRTIHARRKRLD